MVSLFRTFYKEYAARLRIITSWSSHVRPVARGHYYCPLMLWNCMFCRLNTHTKVRPLYISRLSIELEDEDMQVSFSRQQKSLGSPRCNYLWYFIFVFLVRAGGWLLFNGLLALLFSLSYVIVEFNRFLHRRLAKRFPSRWKSRVLIAEVTLRMLYFWAIGDQKAERGH